VYGIVYYTQSDFFLNIIIHTFFLKLFNLLSCLLSYNCNEDIGVYKALLVLGYYIGVPKVLIFHLNNKF